MSFSSRRSRSETPKLLRFIVVSILVLGGILIAIWLYWQNMNAPVDPNGQVQAFVVEQGQSTEEIITELKAEGLIRSEWAFKWRLQQSGQAGNLQAGDFKLSPAMNYDQLIVQLSSGVIDQWITLIEGWRVEEMANRLEAQMGLNKEEFIEQAKEGYMFPDTYLINKEATVADVVSILENTFNQRFDADLKAKMAKNGLTPEQGVILASIVEREARSDEVRTQVASILLKRLQIDMGLNADATIQYALGYQPAEKSWWKKALTYEDLKIDSPYNTYLHAGLPPTPICNPSLSSLRAVANADPTTPYLYYIHDNNGHSYYAQTLEEHNQNVNQYLR